MGVKDDRRSARWLIASASRVLAQALALVWLMPAIRYNVDWSGNADWGSNAAAVGMIAGTALLIHVALAKPTLVRTPAFMVVALFLVYGNTKQAVRTLSLGGEVASEVREARMVAASHLASQRSRLETRRAAQAEIAGEDAVTTLEASVEALKISDPTRWRQTNGCAPDKVTTSREFCLQVTEARKKVAAAVERDKVDGEIRALPTLSTEVVPKVADAYVANVISLLSEMGLRPSPRLVAAEEAMTRALGLELLAAFGPACWLGFLNFAAGTSTAVSRFKGPTKKLKSDEVSIAPGAPAKADSIDRWIADELELHEGGVAFAKELRATPGWPANHPGMNEKMVWSRLKNMPGVKHDPNSGRPRYIGLRLRTKRPVLTVVDGSRA
jgi:hypothetical protein